MESFESHPFNIRAACALHELEDALYHAKPSALSRVERELICGAMRDMRRALYDSQLADQHFAAADVDAGSMAMIDANDYLCHAKGQLEACGVSL